MPGQVIATRRFWWDRTRPTDADVHPLRAVIFDLDGAMADIDCDGELAPRSGLIDLVMSLFVAGVWVGVVSTGRRTQVEPLVRELIGDGLVETIVTSDDTESTEGADLYASALWELGIEPENALAVVGSSAGLGIATEAGLATVVVSTDDIVDRGSSTAAVVRARYDGIDPLLSSGCRRVHRRWWTAQKRVAA